MRSYLTSNAHFRPPYLLQPSGRLGRVTGATAVFSRAIELSRRLAGRSVELDCKKPPIMSIFTYVILIGVAIFGIQHWLKNKSYIFKAEDISKIAKRHVGNGKYEHKSLCNTFARTSTR